VPPNIARDPSERKNRPYVRRAVGLRPADLPLIEPGPAAPGSDPPSDGVRPADPPLDLSTRPPTDSVQGSPRRSVRCSLANSVRPGLHRTLDTASTGLNPVIFTNFLGMPYLDRWAP